MSLLIAIAISVAVAVWVAPGLWRDFRAGIIFPGSMSIKRADHPFIYWMTFALQAGLIVAWSIAVAIALPSAIRDISN